MAGMEESGDGDGMNSVHCPDGPRVKSPAGSGAKMQSDVKETIGMLKKTFRESIRRVGEKSPLSSNSKRSKVSPKCDMGSHSDDPGPTRLQAPPSPSLSAGSPRTTSMKSISGFFQKKEENGAEGSALPVKKPLSHSRTLSEPSMALSDSFMKRGASIRRSLRLISKKDKPANQEVLLTVSEVIAEDKKVEDAKMEEIDESYVLPEIPLTPLSVMQISKLIEMEVLEEAHLNLLSLRQEFQQERERYKEEVSSMELAKKEKDLSLLYADLRNKVKTIVRDSNSLPSRNKGLLVHVARIIQEEEKRELDPGGLAGPGSWREAWREAVGEGVQAKLQNVHLDTRERNPSWLAVHLGLLGKAIVEDLENVKKEFRWSYPPSFHVFGTYVRCYHSAVGQHLKLLQQQVTELRDFYALLDFIINRYQSERIMGSPSLRPEMESESPAPDLEPGFLDQLKKKYCSRVQEELRFSLEKIIEIENEELWKDRQTPEKEEDFLNSPIHMDIWTKVHGNVVNSRRIDTQLESDVFCSCLEELKKFPKRFEMALKRSCNCAEVPHRLWAEYQITYINSFTALKQHMEEYRHVCPAQVDNFSKEVNWLVVRLGQGLEDQYKIDVKPFLRRMMTRKWLTNDDDFQQLYSRTEQLSQHCALMRPPYRQTLVDRLHYHTVKEYISQLMTNNYSCKNRKHEKAARKIRKQWAELKELFKDM
ncbi:exocyst complex component 3-like protein 4 isoform X2 [Lampris incognitus]|nr:exocyst complex component 3-like protein 4 isoform X2 [Lampris incognitus]